MELQKMLYDVLHNIKDMVNWIDEMEFLFQIFPSNYCHKHMNRDPTKYQMLSQRCILHYCNKNFKFIFLIKGWSQKHDS